MSYLLECLGVTLNELDAITKQLSTVSTINPKAISFLHQFVSDLHKTIVQHELVDLIAIQFNFSAAFEAQAELVRRINDLDEALSFFEEAAFVLPKLQATKDHLLLLSVDHDWSKRMDMSKR